MAFVNHTNSEPPRTAQDRPANAIVATCAGAGAEKEKTMATVYDKKPVSRICARLGHIEGQCFLLTRWIGLRGDQRYELTDEVAPRPSEIRIRIAALVQPGLRFVILALCAIADRVEPKPLRWME